MIAVGVDLGKDRHAAAIFDGCGRRLAKTAFHDNSHDGAKRLWEAVEAVSDGEVRVGMEATGNCWKPLHDFLVARGAKVSVINPIVSSASMAGDVRGRKTDKRDAEVIADLVVRGRCHGRVADAASTSPKYLVRQRGALVGMRTMMKNRLRDLLLDAFPEYPALFDDLVAPLPIALLEKYPGAAALAKARRDAVAKVVAEKSRGKDAGAEAGRLVSAAKNSIRTAHPPAPALAKCILSTLRTMADLDRGIADLDKAITECEPLEMAASLSKINGAGKLNPMVVAAEFGDLKRFETNPASGEKSGMAKRMLAFAGCEPRVRESGKWKGMLKMSKRGNGHLRQALYLMANSIRQHDPFFKAVYEAKKAKGKHHTVALFHVVRKLLEVVCAIHKSGREYSTTPPSSTAIVNPEP